MSLFIHLRVHSAFSLAEGAIKIPALVKACQEFSMPAVALTDTSNLFGAMEFSLQCQKSGVQPIIGVQINLRIEDSFFQIVLLVRNQQGYGNLLKLVSRSFLRKETESPPYINIEELKEHCDGLICLTGGKKGPIDQLIIQNKDDLAKNILLLLRSLFHDDLYIELSRHGDEVLTTEEKLLDFAYEHGICIVATNEAFFLDKSMYEAHDALLCIADSKHIEDMDRRRETPNHYLRPPEEMIDLFKDLPEAIENTIIIAKKCAFMVEPQKPILPPFPSDRTEEEELRYQAFEGLKIRLWEQVLTNTMTADEKQEVSKQYTDRLEFEISIIERMGFAGYYLIVADFIKWAKSQDIPVGPGRGSGAGSLVAWSLTITDIDPIKFGLLFERFLNPERVSMPDFDVDFCQDRRDEVIDYVRRRYGDDRVAQIITFGKLQAKAVVRDVGRVMGIPYGYVDKISKLIPHNPANPVTLEEAIVQEPQIQQIAADDPQIAELLSVGKKLEGLYRHASTHAAGVVIGGQPLDTLVPLYHDGQGSIPATQFHMKHVEMAGLVKFDFLGLKTLSVIQKTINLLKNRGVYIDITKIPLDDERTFELLQRVEAVGIFQLESAGMRDVMRKLHPQKFEELIALVALYRPGPMDDIPRYLACKHGDEAVSYGHPMLESILKETFGVMVYQEQVMQIAQTLSGYSLGEADLLRRAMGKKIKSEMDAQSEMFIDGAIKNGVGAADAAKIFEQAAKFAGYGFNKCHSAPYALIAYQTAFLKANYPVEFMASSMTYDMNNTDKITVFKEDLDRMGIEVLPPDINKSMPDFSVESLNDSNNTLAVRYALSAIKGVGIAAMADVIAERESNGPFKSIFNFARRLNSKSVNKRILEKLIAAGAFDTMHADRSALLASIDSILGCVGENEAVKNDRQGSLFTSISSTPKDPDIFNTDPMSRLELLNLEFQAMGFYFSAHPLNAYGDRLSSLSIVNSNEMRDIFAKNDGASVPVAAVVVTKKERLSKKGNKYAFVQFSDQGGAFEVTFFSELYARYREQLDAGSIFYLRIGGKIENDAMRLTVQDACPIEEMLKNTWPHITIDIEKIEACAKVANILNKLDRGRTKIKLRLRTYPAISNIELGVGVLMNQDAFDKLSVIRGVNILSQTNEQKDKF